LLDSKGNSKICGFINCINYSAKKKDENGIFACSYKGDEYLSPEVIKRHLFDHSIDYWALGIIVYRMFKMMIFLMVLNGTVLKKVQSNHRLSRFW